MPLFRFVCSICGPKEEPCEHHEQSEIQKEFKFLHYAVLEIIHLLHRPFSATIKFEGVTMPKTIAPGGTATAVFQEWTGPSGTGTVVPNAGSIAFSSDNTAVATVDASTGAVTAIADGTANISGKDSVNNLSASDVLTVQSPAQSATLTLQ